MLNSRAQAHVWLYLSGGVPCVSRTPSVRGPLLVAEGAEEARRLLGAKCLPAEIQIVTAKDNTLSRYREPSSASIAENHVRPPCHAPQAFDVARFCRHDGRIFFEFFFTTGLVTLHQKYPVELNSQPNIIALQKNQNLTQLPGTLVGPILCRICLLSRVVGCKTDGSCKMSFFKRSENTIA
jgi:hypothetical protein